MAGIGKISLACAAALLATSSALLAQDQDWPIRGGQGGGTCATFPSISGAYTAAPGTTNGVFGTPVLGATYTVRVTGAGTGTFRIVGDPSGTVTYAGPGAAPGSLSFTVTGAPPVGAQGIGFFFDSGSGPVTVEASCSVFRSVPVNDRSALVLLGLVGGLFGLAALRLRG